MSDKNSIVFYVRNDNGFPLACVSAIKSASGGVNIGISVHNPRDKFDRHLARRIATGRAEALGRHDDPARNNAVWYCEMEDLSGEDVFEQIKYYLTRCCEDGTLSLPQRVRKALAS